MITAQQQEAIDAVAQHGSQRAAARALGINGKSLRSRLERAARWEEADPALKNAANAIGTNFIPRRAWTKTDKHGNTTYSVESVAEGVEDDKPSPLELMREAFNDIPKTPAIIAPPVKELGKVALFPHGDWHFGSYVTADQAGADYNREIAMDRLNGGFAKCMGAIQPCETAIILNNGDFHHADMDNRDATPRHGHRLKVEGTSHENIRLTTHASIGLIDLALKKHGNIIYRANPGNHDENVPSALGLALAIRYANEPRVTVEDTENHTWVFHKGQLFIATNHGHGQPPAKFAPNLPTRYPDQFGKSRGWYYISSHFHNREDVTVNGIRCIRLPALCAIDGHGAQLGFTDTAGMSAMVFDEADGSMPVSLDISFTV